MMTAMLAAQAIAGLAHVHSELAESSSVPHIHLSGQHHGHSHDGHHHGHDHHHHNDDAESETPESSTEICPLPVCDLAFVITPEVLLWHGTERFETKTETFVLNLSFGARFVKRLSDSFVAKPPESRIALAHAPMLNKIRLLL